MNELAVPRELLESFENGLNTRFPEKSLIPAEILGYGEISTVFSIRGAEGLACKRMPLFQNWEELDRYEKTFLRYQEVLERDAGIRLPKQQGVRLRSERGQIVYYIIQERIPPESIGDRAIRAMDPKGVESLFERVLVELAKVWKFNAKRTGVEIGLDGQISNWAIPSSGPDPRLFYFDTSTPLMRIDGVEQLDPELFLRSAPSFMLWIIRWLFLEDVMTRYYDPHKVVVDLIANFYKEQRPELIPLLIRKANGFFAERLLSSDTPPVTEQEVRRYYREDAWIWRIYLAFRKTDRFLRERILRKRYPYILPGRIRR